MNIGIMGTRTVAQALAGGWTEAGHSVTLGSRDPESKMDLSFPGASLDKTARNAAAVVNATPGGASKDLLGKVDTDALAGKLLIDVANAVIPSFELVYPNSSLGEELQEMLPDVKIVKALSTCAAMVFVNPSQIGPGSIFVSGDDADAKGEGFCRACGERALSLGSIMGSSAQAMPGAR